MIKGTFKLGSEVSEVIIRGNELLFFDVSSGQMTNIAGLKLSRVGCVKEFPDLKNDEDWRLKTIERFKQKIKELKNEMERINYVKEELIKQGYEPMMLQKAGFRPQRFK